MGDTMTAPTTERRNLRAPDLLDLTGATYRQLDYWCRTYALCGDPTPGSGQSRMFTITEARVVRALVLIGDHSIAVGTYARGIHTALHALPAAEYLVLHEDKASAHVMYENALHYAGKTAVVATLVPLRFRR